MAGNYTPLCLLILVTITTVTQENDINRLSHDMKLINSNVATANCKSSSVLSRASDDTWYNIGPGSENAINRVDVIKKLPEPTNGPPVTLGPDHPPKTGPTGQTGPSGQPGPSSQSGQIHQSDSSSQTKPTAPLPQPPQPSLTTVKGTSAYSNEQSPQPSQTEVTSQATSIVASARTTFSGATASVLSNLNATKPIEMSDLVAVGCFRDSYLHPRPLPKLILDLRDDSDNASMRQNFNDTIVACAREAYRLDYTFFGLQAEGECWSGEGSERTYKRDGRSADCHHGVGKSGSNFVYKFTGAYAKSCKNCGPPRAMCFPASARVTLKTSDVIKMEDLKIGDEIQTIDFMTNQIIYTEVITFLHKDSSKEKFLAIDGEDGSQLVVSHKHLIYSGKTTKTMMMKFADEVKTGDFILSQGTAIKVKTVKTVYDIGIYAPMTRAGTMLVNGVYVSCYAHWSSHEVSHLVTSPVRLWFDLSKVVRNIATFVGLSQPIERSLVGDGMLKGVHGYADVLRTLVHYLPKSMSDMYHT